MGLLDLMNSDTGVLGAALLAAGAPQAVRPNFGQGLLNAMGQAQSWKAQEEERRQKAMMMQAQIAEIQAQAQQRQSAVEQAQRKAAEEARQRLLLQKAFSPVSPVNANSASGVTGPRPEALQAVGGQPKVNYQQLIAQGLPPELVKSLAESANYGTPEVARTIEGRDEQGRPVTLQFDKQGRQIGQGVQQWKAPERIDTGGAINIWDPITRATLQQIGKTNTPDAVLGAQTTMRGQNMTDARQREANAVTAAGIGKVDWKQDANGQWIALPKEINGTGPVTPVVASGPGKREQQSQNAIGIIDAAEKLIDKSTSSYIGAGIDLGARAFGASTPGAQAAAQLKALEGALVMAQPRMEGPQSDKDTALYRQMAAQIGDPTIPADTKKAALATVRELHQRYAGGGTSRPASSGQIKFLGFE